MTAMERRTIAVDVDDVLASIHEGMRLFINEHFDTRHTTEDYTVLEYFSGRND